LKAGVSGRADQNAGDCHQLSADELADLSASSDRSDISCARVNLLLTTLLHSGQRTFIPVPSKIFFASRNSTFVTHTTSYLSWPSWFTRCWLLSLNGLCPQYLADDASLWLVHYYRPPTYMYIVQCIDVREWLSTFPFLLIPIPMQWTDISY